MVGSMINDHVCRYLRFSSRRRAASDPEGREWRGIRFSWNVPRDRAAVPDHTNVRVRADAGTRFDRRHDSHPCRWWRSGANRPDVCVEGRPRGHAAVRNGSRSERDARSARRTARNTGRGQARSPELSGLAGFALQLECGDCTIGRRKGDSSFGFEKDWPGRAIFSMRVLKISAGRAL